jgi:opacity protein-like surface antigen
MRSGRSRGARARLVSACVFALVTASSAWAQGSRTSHGRASGTAGASLGDGGIAPSFGLALSYWPTRRVGIEFELAYSRNLEFTLDLCPAPLVCILGGQLPVKGRTLSLVPHLVLEPTTWERVHPYAVAGVGMAHLRQRYTVGSVGVGGQDADTLVVPAEFTRSKRALALSVGAGVEVQVTRRLALGVDVRSRHLLDEEARFDRFIVPAGTLDTLRVGSHASWQF